MSTIDSNQLAEEHTFLETFVFKAKANGLSIKRGVENLQSGLKKFKRSDRLNNEEVISFSESALWNPNDNSENWILTAGKVENLRIATKKLNGLVIPAGAIFSFWKHIGNPNFAKGYVVGREIREGCIIPTIAGGLCQLSNALYDAALKANFEIVERHQHTQVIKGSLAEKNRDATVKWNYIDLRFRSEHDFRIEAELTADNLIVRFKGIKPEQNSEKKANIVRPTSILNDCYSCGNTACFKHPNKSGEKQPTSNTTYILDEKWPEFDDYLQNIVETNDQFIVPMQNNPIIKTNRYHWTAAKGLKTTATTNVGIQRALRMHLAPKRGQNVFQLSLHADEQIAKRATQQIPLSSTHLVVSQNLLPHLYKLGVLAGRTYDVLMTRLPAQHIQNTLDEAFKIYPDSPTLKDFRAPKEFINIENEALTKARKIITPHQKIAAIFANKSIQLDWKTPEVAPLQTANNQIKTILFPASAVGRKGAYEIKRLRKELNFELVIIGRSIEKVGFWEGNPPQHFDSDFSKIDAVVYPTYIEHQPRVLLKALALDIPVITTAAAGLSPHKKLTIIDQQSYEQMKNTIQKVLHL